MYNVYILIECKNKTTLLINEFFSVLKMSTHMKRDICLKFFSSLQYPARPYATIYEYT